MNFFSLFLHKDVTYAMCTGLPLAWMAALQGCQRGMALLWEDASKEHTKKMICVPGEGHEAQEKDY